jgi:HemY protein
MVAQEPGGTRPEKMRKRRRQAVIETARARDAEGSDPLAALDHALVALRLAPDFVPAALIAARIHAHRGEGRRAMSLLRRVWRATSHPDVAALYANAVPGASAVDRFRRIRELIEVPTPNREAAVVFARAAIEAYDWGAARSALAPYTTVEPTQAVCLLMAEIEEGQNGDQGKAREWLARAVHAPADPAWTADGVIAAEWTAVSPVTGKLDAFEWKVPVESAPPRPPAPAGTALAVVPGTALAAGVPREPGPAPA